MNETTKSKGEKTRAKILEAIITYISEHGYSPTVREIGEMVGLKSTSTVYTQLTKMLEMGMIETDGDFGQPRAIRIPGYRFVNVDKIVKQLERSQLSNKGEYKHLNIPIVKAIDIVKGGGVE